MIKNFRVGQGNELVIAERTFDLHNRYDFGGLAVAFGGRARLWFTPNPIHGDSDKTLVLDVEDVDRLDVAPGVLAGTVEDIDEVGYKAPLDNDMEWLTGERHATSEDHLVFLFASGEFIRVHGGRAHLSELSGPIPAPSIRAKPFSKGPM